jgi:hypothetical protein
MRAMLSALTLQLLPLTIQSFLRYRYVKIAVLPCSAIFLVTKHVSQKVELLSWSPKVDHPRAPLGCLCLAETKSCLILAGACRESELRLYLVMS